MYSTKGTVRSLQAYFLLPGGLHLAAAVISFPSLPTPVATAFIGLGTNLGDRLQNLALAREQLAANGFPMRKASSIYETTAWGAGPQPDYLNQVLEIQTTQPPEAVLESLLAIEHRLGRVRNERWGPRLIDLDLLLHGSEVRTTTRLTLPHPYLHERRFVLAPLAEIAPHWAHPVLQQSIAALLCDCTDPTPVRIFIP